MDTLSNTGRQHRSGGASALCLFALLFAGPVLATAFGPQTGGPTREDRVAVGDEAIDFTLESIDGETFRLRDLRGEKNAVVIFFRGTW